MNALRIIGLALVVATMLASTAAARSEVGRGSRPVHRSLGEDGSSAAGIDGATPAPGSALDAAARAAIVEAVRERLGVSAEVSIDRLWLPNLRATASSLTAIAEPGARLGRAITFRLMAPADAATAGPAVRLGSAVASLTVRVRHARLVTALRPGVVVGAAETAENDDVVSGVRLHRLPLPAEVAGARVRQTLAVGTVIEEWMLEREPLVRSGEVVGVRTVVDGVEARTMVKAVERGAIGDVIRLVNVQSGRSLKGRVIAKGEVEVVP
jgi:flagellar basal body P-ring formation protein FlgA